MQEKSSKKKLFVPTFFIILMLVLGILGLLAFYGAKETINSCTKEVKGIVDREGYGVLRKEKKSVDVVAKEKGL